MKFKNYKFYAIFEITSWDFCGAKALNKSCSSANPQKPLSNSIPVIPKSILLQITSLKCLIEQAKSFLKARKNFEILIVKFYNINQKNCFGAVVFWNFCVLNANSPSFPIFRRLIVQSATGAPVVREFG